MKVLVINSGSSSLKYQLIDMETEAVIAKGTCERIGIDGSKLTHKAKGQETVYEQAMPDHTVAVSLVLNALTDEKVGVISSMSDIDAVGHRAVASGEVFKKPTLVTEDSIAFTVKQRAENAIARFNRQLRRSSFVKTQILPRENGDFSVVMALDDEQGNLMTLELMAPDQRQAVRLSKLFERKAEDVYNLTMAELLDEEDSLDD